MADPGVFDLALLLANPPNKILRFSHSARASVQHALAAHLAPLPTTRAVLSYLSLLLVLTSQQRVLLSSKNIFLFSSHVQAPRDVESTL